MILTTQILNNWCEIKASITEEKLKHLTVLPVTKMVSTVEIEQLIQLGFTTFAENRVDVALPKIKALSTHDITWDFIGNIQSRKIPSIVQNFKLIHSVASFKTAKKINEAAKTINKSQQILLQINIAEEEQKSGFSAEEIREQIKDILLLEHITVKGLMTMAPHTTDQSIISNTFADLKVLSLELETMTNHHFNQLSMGMSNDYLLAAQAGSTILRIGSAFFKEEV